MGRNYLDHCLEVVDIVGTRPLLMGQYIDTCFRLWLLDHLAICSHSFLCKTFAKVVADQGRRVKASQSNEAPAVT